MPVEIAEAGGRWRHCKQRRCSLNSGVNPGLCEFGCSEPDIAAYMKSVPCLSREKQLWVNHSRPPLDIFTTIEGGRRKACEAAYDFETKLEVSLSRMNWSIDKSGRLRITNGS